MLTEDIRHGLYSERRHLCAQCLALPARVVVYDDERHGSGTLVGARCHGRVQRQIVTDATIEDGRRVYWFLEPADGEPCETTAERKRRLLREEIEAERSRRKGEG